MKNNIRHSRSAVLRKVRIERMTQTEFGALYLEQVAAVDLLKVPPAAAATEHLVTRSHHLFFVKEFRLMLEVLSVNENL